MHASRTAETNLVSGPGNCLWLQEHATRKEWGTGAVVLPCEITVSGPGTQGYDARLDAVYGTLKRTRRMLGN